MARKPAAGHVDHAVRLRNRVLTSGVLERSLRLQALERGAGGPPMPEPYDALARRIGGDSARVTDEQVASVRNALGSDVRAFELVLAAAVGAGLRRWDAAARRSTRRSMRLDEIERGDTLRHRLLIALISLSARFRLPDAARVAFYDRAFAGPALGEWTQRTMRGPSAWTVPERELMAAAVASWNACPFCVGAHGAIAVRGIDRAVVDAVVEDYRSAPIPQRLRAALAFLETLTREPDALGAADVLVALSEGLTTDELRDAAAVAAVFNVITRYANALDFEIPSPADFDAAAAMLLRRGYS